MRNKSGIHGIIFISTFILISQNLLAQVANPIKKAENKYEDIYTAKPIQINYSEEVIYDPHDYESFIYKAEEKIQEEKYKEAIIDLKQAKKQFDENFLGDNSKLLGSIKDGEPSYLIAYCFIQLAQYDSGIFYLNESIEYQPLNIPAYNLKGYTFLLKGDTFRVQLRILLRDLHYNYDKSLRLRKKIEALNVEALVSLNKALELNPKNPNTIHSLAFAYYISGDRYSALKYINHNLKINSDFLRSYKLKADMIGYTNVARLNSIYDRAVNNNTENPEVYYMRGIHYLFLGRYKKAEEDVYKGISMKGDSALGMYALSAIKFKRGKDVEAIPTVIKFYETNGFLNDSKTYFYSDFEQMAHIELLRESKLGNLNELDKIAFGNYEKGHFLRRRFKPEYNKLLNSKKNDFDSTTFFRKVRAVHLFSLNDKKINLKDIDIILDEDSSNAFKFLKGKHLYQNDFYEKASSELSEMLEVNNNFLYAKYYLALSYKELNMHREALKLLDDCIEMDPEIVQFKVEKAQNIHFSGSSEESLRILKQLRKDHVKNPYILTAIAEVYLDMGKSQMAETYLNKSLKLDSFYVLPLILRARNLVKRKKYLEAKIEYEKANRFAPNNVFALNELGDLYFQFERYEEAKSKYYECTQLRNLNTSFKLSLTKSYLKLKEYENAIRVCKEVYQIDSNLTQCYETFGNIYLEKGEVEASLENFKLAFEKDPIGFKEYGNFAHVYYKSEQFEKAEAMALEAIKSNNGDFRTSFLLGITKLRLNKTEEAQLIYSEIFSNSSIGIEEKRLAKSMLLELLDSSENTQFIEQLLLNYFN